jgi:hypothetical protein
MIRAQLMIALFAAGAGAPPDAGSAPPDAADAAPAPAPDESPPAACTGADLDLDKIFASKACDVPGKPNPPPDAALLGMELSPRQLKLESGKTAQVTIRFRNRAADLLPVDLDVSCGEAAFETELYAGKKRADFSADCGFGRGCGRRTVRVMLAPHGVARVHVPVSATFEALDAECMPAGRKPIRPGAYKLIVNTPFQDRVAGTVNQVRTRTVEGRLLVVAARDSRKE